jgi:hypothetical protein
MKILIAVDGSECSDVAIEEVSNRPWPADSAVRIISVAEILPLEVLSLPPRYREEIERAARHRVETIVERAMRSSGPPNWRTRRNSSSGCRRATTR